MIDLILIRQLADIQQLRQIYEQQLQQDSWDLYGESLLAISAGNLVPVVIPDSFGPED